MIDVKTEDAIATVTMRQGKANALDITLCEALADCFDKLCASGARAVVLTGQGHIFSAGVDLLQVSAGGADYIRRFSRSCIACTRLCSFIRNRWWRRSTAMPLPAAVCSPAAQTGASWRAAAGAWRSRAGRLITGRGRLSRRCSSDLDSGPHLSPVG